MTHCKRGHKFTAANTYRYRGHRTCRACRQIAAGRTRWARVEDAKIQRELAEVRRRLFRVHPDYGGSGKLAPRVIAQYQALRARVA